MHDILIVEDMASLAMTYAAHLESAGHRCTITDSAASALHELDRHPDRYSAILLDLQLPDEDGLDLLTRQPELTRRYAVIVATADGSIGRAIAAMRLGAYDFLVKPLSPARLAATMASALSTRDTRIPAEPAALPVPDYAADGFQGFIGMSPPILAVYRQIENVARSRATVFITGESGTGKEVCAEAIHKSGPRAAKPFIAINCGAIPEDLLESELFGHLRGSFTGAVSDRVGAAQAAHGGTLFLDEICEMAPKLQVKLLRFLQTGTVQRVGSSKTEEVDVRIICATNRHPETEVAAGRFREDLFYRLAVIPIEMPPLRARGSDIVLLANRFLQRYGEEEHKHFNRLAPDLALAMSRHQWPGNVRELQNLMRRAAVMFQGPDLPLEAITRIINPGTPPASSTPTLAMVPGDGHAVGGAHANGLTSLSLGDLDGMTLDEIERLVIDRAIDRAGGSVPAAARQLGISPSTLYRKRERWQEAG